MTKTYKMSKIVYTFIFSIISLLAFLIDINVNEIVETFLIGNKFVDFFIKIYFSLKEFDIIYVTLWIFIIYFYFNTYFDSEKYNKKNNICIILSIIFSILTLIGKTYYIKNTLEILIVPQIQIFKSIILLLGYYFMYYAIIKKIRNYNLNIKILKKKNSFLQTQINDYPFATSVVLIIIMWLPYIIVSIPGISTGDTLDELSQFFHLETSWSIDSINLINENVYVNKHHSVFHTVIMGMIYKFGNTIISYSFGALLYTLLQVLLSAIIFGFMIKYLKKIKINNLIIILSLFFIGLNPTIVTFVICAIKDTPSAIFNLLYVIFLLQIVRNYNSIFNNKLRIIIFLITILFVLLLRNNGIYTILLSFPLLFVLYKNKWKKILLTLIIPLTIFGMYDKILLPSYDISNGSIREVLSIPIMQLSRVVYYKADEFNEEEKQIINKVLDFNSMENIYDPNISDNVKNSYNKDTTKEQLKDLFKVWLKYLKKYPHIYISSMLNSTYGYFSPQYNTEDLYLYDFQISSPVYDIKSIPQLVLYRSLINQLMSIYYKLPFFINKVAYYDWILILSCIYIIKKKKYKYLIPLTPLLITLLVCIASPLNGSFRYILPIIFSIPIIISIDYIVYKECNNSKKY